MKDTPLSFVFCGAGGSRTLVQTCRKTAFYKFSSRLVCRRLHGTEQAWQPRIFYVFARISKPMQTISPFMTLLDRTLDRETSGEAPAAADLVCAAESATLTLRMHKNFRHLLASRVDF